MAEMLTVKPARGIFVRPFAEFAEAFTTRQETYDFDVSQAMENFKKGSGMLPLSHRRGVA